MRGKILVAIVSWGLVGLIVLVTLVGGLFFRGKGLFSRSLFSHVSSGDLELYVDESFSLDGIKEIELSLGSDMIDIYPAEDDAIRVVQHGVNLEESRVIVPAISGSRLVIEKHGSSFSFGINLPSKSQVDLYIPAKFKQELSLHLSSGSLRIHDRLDLEKFSAKVSSGKIGADDDIAAKEADLEVTSGTIQLEGLDAENFSMSISSGAMKLSALTGSGDLKITSGTMKLDNVSITDSLKAEVSSGKIDLALEPGQEFQFRGKKSSGTIRTYFDTWTDSDSGKDLTAVVGQNPERELSVKVTSGTISITEA